MTYAARRGHALIGRALYLPEGCAANDKHRELAGVPEGAMFASKPQLAGVPLDRAQSLGTRATFAAGDEGIRGCERRRSIHSTRWGYVMAVRANHTVTTGSARAVTAVGTIKMIPACA